MRVINPTALRLFSYLKIDSHYEVPLDILKGEVDRFGCQLMLCLKHQGGIRHLRSYLIRGDRSRGHPPDIVELAHTFEQQSLQGSNLVADGCNEQPCERDRSGLSPVDQVEGVWESAGKKAQERSGGCGGRDCCRRDGGFLLSSPTRRSL